jgi:sulfite exporter TauE/SafE
VNEVVALLLPGAIDPALAQLVTVGVLWMTFHCVGMCGPIVGGVVGGRARSVPAALAGLALYQSGRALTLGVLGALAGALGSSVAAIVDDGRIGGALALALGLLLASSLVPGRPTLSIPGRRRAGWRARLGAAGERFARRLAVVATVVDQRVGRRPFALGALLGLLPCMIVAWGLSLAASTGDAVRGARVMLVLVAMTTIPLGAGVVLGSSSSGIVARLLGAWPALRGLPVVVSSAWLVMVGLAGLGVVDHGHVVVDVAGPRTIMLW